MSSINLYLFGAPRLEKDGLRIEIDTRKAIALLAYLALTGGQHGRDSLAALLWPEYDQTRARAALRRTLSALNKALGADILDVDREIIAVSPSGELWCDVLEFKRLLGASQGIDSDSGTRSSQLEKAVRLYRDDFMAGFSLRDSLNFDDWQFYQAETLRTDLAGALEILVRTYGEKGVYETALAHARRWSSLDPLREEAHRQLMQIYAWSGQRNAALRQYRECVRILEKELGVSPLEETTQMYQAILENRLEKPETSSPHLPHPPAPQLPGSLAPLLPSYPLVGRAREWAALREAYAAARPDGRLCFLEGEAGIGKTRLAEEFLGSARQAGARIFQARCFEGETGLAYGPFLVGFQELLEQPQVQELLDAIPRQWLSEASRLLPEIKTRIPDLPPSTPIDGPGAQVRFFEGLRQVLLGILAGDPPGVLFIDDLHWADAASLEFLTYLSRRMKEMPIFILVTARDDSSEGRGRMLKLHAEAVRAAGGQCLRLERLSQPEIIELLHSTNLHPSVGKRLYQESEGLPLIAIYYLQEFARGGTDQLETAWATPGSIQAVLRARLADLDDVAGQLLTTAAVIGRSFDFNTLKTASGRSESETVGGIETLLARSLIQERAEGDHGTDVVFDFTHEKLRQLVYEDTSLVRRRLLHRRVAEVLSVEAPNRAALIANHYHLAGEDDRAALFFKLAGEHARTLYANQEAITHFQAALASGHQDETWLYEAIADLQTLNGDYRQAIASYETALALIETAPSEHDELRTAFHPSSFISHPSAALEHKLGELHHRLGDWELAEKHFRAALERLSPGDGAPGNHPLASPSHPAAESVASLAHLLADWSRTAHHRGDEERALNLAQEALRLAESSQDQLALTKTHNILGMLARGQGDYSLASDRLERSLAVADKIAEPGARIAALNNLALVQADLGRLDKAIGYTQTALDLCLRLGDRHREAALRNNLADLFYKDSQVDAAMEQLKQAVVIFAEIGAITGQADLEDRPNPAVWMLTEW